MLQPQLMFDYSPREVDLQLVDLQLITYESSCLCCALLLTGCNRSSCMTSFTNNHLCVSHTPHRLFKHLA
jgi:hypothetical protein